MIASGPADTNRMQHQLQRVYIETHRHRISGLLTLPSDGYRSRLSDFLNSTERDFISLTECTVELIGREGPGTWHEFITVSRGHIVIALPHGQEAPGEAAA
jgi:hypothetical protein